MAEKVKDVKATAESSAAEDVKKSEESSATEDVKTESSTEKKHEETVPYERLKEKVDEVETLKTKLAEKEAEIDPYAGLLEEETVEAEPVTDMEAATAKFREAMEDNPLQTLTQFVNQLNYNAKTQDRKNEGQVRNIPGFDGMESNYRKVPDELVIKAQQNPEMVRFLLAQHEKAVRGGKTATQETTVTTEKPETMEELAEKYRTEGRTEGEQKIIARIKTGESIVTESASSAAVAGEDKPELDDYGKKIAMSLGLSEKDFAPMAKGLEAIHKKSAT